MRCTQTLAGDEDKQMNSNTSRYDYQFDPNGESTAAQVCRLAGSGQRVLELGCAAGAMSAVLVSHYGCEVTGVEYDATAAEQARRFCHRVVLSNLDNPDWHEPLAGLQFDTIVAADVLEHLRNPLACLQQARKLLTANGQLVVSVPNIAHSGVLAALLSNDFPYRETGLLDRTHIHFFTALTLGQTLAQAGFSVAAMQTVDTGPWHPEFKWYWDGLPASIRVWLAGNPAGKAFQIIMRAHPQEQPIAYDDPSADATQQWLAEPGEIAVLQTELASLRQCKQSLTQALDDMRAERDRAHANLTAVYGSRSWRLMAPLRHLSRALRSSK